MIQSSLKIKINVIWDKQFKEGEIFAEIFYKYFCSGELSVLPNNVFSIPVRCYPIENYQKTFKAIKDYLTVNILLAEDHMRINDEERKLVQSLEGSASKNANLLYIPIALTKGGCDYIDKGECITAYQGDKDIKEDLKRNNELSKLRGLIREANREYIVLILRRVLERIAGQYFFNVGISHSKKVGLFICHTKSTGYKELEGFQAYLSSKTNSDFFVDKNSIELGDRFDEKILKNIPARAMLIILTDGISTREWCLREIQEAKKYNRPILVVDALSISEGRLYPYIGNIPVIRLRIGKGGKLQNGDLIYEALVNEILWNTYNVYRNKYGEKVKVLSRKVELMDLAMLDKKYSKIVYPEPPIGKTEKSILQSMISKMKGGINITFETEISAQMSRYKGISPKVMISSASNPVRKRVDGLSCCVGINYAVREITRYLIYLGCPILNAGNYEAEGFNRVIMEQIEQYAGEIQERVGCIHYVNGYKIREEEEKYNKYKCEFSNKGILFKEVSQNVSSNSEAMNLIREEITTDADMQLVIGGMNSADGRKTGIEKEVELCIKKGKSVYLLGGFGFKAKELCDKYITSENYVLLNNGLTLAENKKLSNMYDIGGILNLILKGWYNRLGFSKPTEN